MKGSPACLVCGKPPIEAHLIPKCFTRDILVEPKSGERHMLHRPDGTFKQATGLGRYSTKLLCRDCDGMLGQYEDSANRLLKRLRTINLGKGIEEFVHLQFTHKTYPFRVRNIKELVKFACGILWKYASLPDVDPSRIGISHYRDMIGNFLFAKNSMIPDEIDAFIERDMLSFLCRSGVEPLYYVTPSVDVLDGYPPSQLVWFSVGGFVIFVSLGGGFLNVAPPRCWMKGKKEPHLLVSKRTLDLNQSVGVSVGIVGEDLRRLNGKLYAKMGVPP